MVDAHCHLQDIPNFNVSNLELAICSGASLESSRQAIEIATKHKNVYVTVGIHPEAIINDQASMINELKGLAREPKVVAIGECGLDSDDPREIDLLKLQVDLAKELNLPLVIHNRNQDQKILDLVGDYPKVMLHCFTGNLDFMQKSVSRGWYISFGGILTFKKRDELREVAKLVPSDRLLTETDAPYLAPEPLRGSPNIPANVKIIAQLLANLRGTSIDQIEAVTRKNCETLFSIPHPA
jgi:TatD DNase family protein